MKSYLSIYLIFEETKDIRYLNKYLTTLLYIYQNSHLGYLCDTILMKKLSPTYLDKYLDNIFLEILELGHSESLYFVNEPLLVLQYRSEAPGMTYSQAHRNSTVKNKLVALLF